MNEKKITVNGYEFTVERSISGDYYRLLYGETLVFDDSACGDFYGDIEAVADIMAEYIKEETLKPHPWFTLLGAYVKQDGAPLVYIDSDTDAERWGEKLNRNCREITEATEFEKAKEELDFDGCDVKHLYAFDYYGTCGCFCLYCDY